MNSPLLSITLCALLVTTSLAETVSSLIQKGDVYDQQFRPAEALQSYLPAEKLNPNDATLLVKIARQYVYRMDLMSSAAQKIESAKTALLYSERAVEASPSDSDAHLSIAISLGKMTPLMSNREKVVASRRIKESAEKAATLNPRSDYAWHILGRWHQALAGMSGIMRGIVKLVYGELPAASNEEAVSCFEKACALKPGRLIHRIELGRTYAQMGKNAEAKTALTKGLAMANTEKDDDETKARGRKTLVTLE